MKHTNSTYLTEPAPGWARIKLRLYLLGQMGIRAITLDWLGH